MIRDPTIHDSWISYPNQFKLWRKNYKHYATRAIFCWTKDRELLLLMKINASPYYVEFSGVFLKWLPFTYRIAGLHCLATLHTEKSKTWEKTTRTAFPNCSSNRCSVKLSKSHRNVPVPEFHLNIVAGLQSAILLRRRPRHRCFPVTTLHMFKSSSARKFLMTF